MLDKILGNLKSEIGSQITGQAKVPPDKVDGIFSVLGEVTKKEVSGHISGGGLGNVMNLFSNKENSSGADQLQSDISSGFINGLMNKLGLSRDTSGSVAGIAVPALINLITRKNSETPDDDPSPLNDIFGGIAKGEIGNTAKNVIGKFIR
jgi:uncharacterized protein YidB (DUF937 family)